MKFQWNLILALIFALIVAVFAVINVEPVRVEYIFGTGEWPLILVILASVLMGGLIVGSVGLVRIFILQRKIRQLNKENESLKNRVESIENQETIRVEERAKETETKVLEQVEANEEDEGQAKVEQNRDNI